MFFDSTDGELCLVVDHIHSKDQIDILFYSDNI